MNQNWHYIFPEKKKQWLLIFRRVGGGGARNLLQILSNAFQCNIFETYLSYWGQLLIAINFIPTTSEQRSETTRHMLCC